MSNTIDNLHNLLNQAKKENPIYELFADGNDFFCEHRDIQLQKTKWRDEIYSKNSLQFADAADKEKQCEALQAIFDLKDIFKDGYKQAVHGDGNEYKRIHTLHSSSLLSLLCFYGLEKEPLTLKLGTMDFQFSRVHFEFKNDLFTHENDDLNTENLDVDGLRKSNIDVALFDSDENDKDGNVLFLESKFTEYFHHGKVTKVSKDVYQKVFRLIALKLKKSSDCAIVFSDDDLHEGYLTVSSGKSRSYDYYGGIKQMISHFLGARTYALAHSHKSVYLGSILYCFPERIEEQGDFSRYSKLYSYLVDALNKLDCKPKNLHVLPQCLTYQEVFKGYPLDKYVKAFYKL